MQTIQLYIEGQRVDIFNDESVVVTDSIKNVMDIDKIFTEFSRTFSVPASSVNNKIFKHYYNNDIQGGFDARVRVKANLELNFLPYKDGYIKLEGVDLKDNKAHTYKITFFGNTISLKQTIGDDLLSNLSWLSNFDFEEDVQNPFPLYFKPTDIERYLTTVQEKTVDGVTYTSPVQVPLLTHTQRLFFDSSAEVADSGNVSWSGAGGIRGVKWNELKYALKVLIIIKAIEKKYTILFSTDFFNNTNVAIKDLFMWMHRTKGVVTNGEQLTSFNYGVTGFTGTDTNISEISNTELTLFQRQQVNVLELSVIPAAGFTTIPYSFIVFKGGVPVYNSGRVTGSQNNVAIPIFYGEAYTVQIIITDTINFSNVDFFVSGFDSDTQSTVTANYPTGTFSVSAQFEFNMLQQIPNMKVLDFLTSIFKMFNLVAYVEDGIIVVKTLDSYYSGGVSYDITKHIDTEKSQSNVALPFREIVYTYEGLQTYFASVHNQLFNQQWGKIEYKTDSNIKFSGDIFNYTIPFEHMKFEKLIDAGNSAPKDIQWGFCVDDNQEPYIGKPILFNLARKTASMSFVNGVDSSNVATSSKEISNYFAPCNSNMNVVSFASQPSLNFDQEPDEWEGRDNTNTLFKDYHSQSITSVFNESNRITKATAYLPLSILLNYNLADKFIIFGKSYKINSITTNLENGKSELELLNDL